MPKKKAEPDPPVVMEPRTTRRAASRAALQNMARLSASAYIDDEDDPDDPSETYDGMSDDEDVPIEHHSKKKKYSLSHRKSSDGNDRDVLVLKTIATPEKNKVAVSTPAKEKASMPPPPPAPPVEKPRVINWNEEVLKLDAWAEDLSPVQLERHNKVNKEIEEINTRIERLIKDGTSEVIYEGENCAAYEIQKTVTNTATSKTGTPTAKSQQHVSSINPTNANANRNNNMQLVMDPRSGVVVGTVSQSPAQVAQNQLNAQRNTRKRGGRQTMSPTPPPKMAKTSPTATNVHANKATESSAVGGLSTGGGTRGVAAVVDLTSEDSSKPAADSREVSFNKLQGKTFPSLVVVARPHLRAKEAAGNDRSKLDAKVKAVLMHVPTKFTEWLIQQGLIRSEQSCSTHPTSKLKLGMYSDVSKFPFSGGYVWISECCPQRFVSVFSGSLFEGSPHAPSVILKLIYHWACQTNVQNVVQWVKVDNLYVKGLNTWLRAACTVALHSHIGPLGGPGCKVEVGVISLGTTSQDGHQRQVKVEVLGLLETDAKRIRLRAVEPLADGDRNYKKRFSKILEPLLQWVHPDSIIITDLTVDKSTLHSMGFKNVQQSTSADSAISNHTIMEYLRRIVPRMFQNTLSLLSRQIIQQFLDELVWREWFGVTAAQAFDNMVLHLSEQTRTETGQSLIMRLNKVAANPFKNWSIKVFGGGLSNAGQQNRQTPIHETSQKRQGGRQRKPALPKSASPPPELRPPKPISPDIPKQMVPLENYYYGTIESDKKIDTNCILSVKCTICRAPFSNNIKLMEHLYRHVQNGPHLCHYCLMSCPTKDNLSNHISNTHPPDTRFNDKFACLLCEIAFDNSYLLGEHMSKEHQPSELPYLCGTCGYRCSSHKQAIDHFYLEHDGGSTIQCPFCLKSTSVFSSGRMIMQNISYFRQHLTKHLKKGLAKKCNKCSLWFIQKDFTREHNSLHESVRYNPGLQPWPVPKANAIMVPKSEFDYQDMEEKELDLNNLVIDLPDTLNCKECEASLNKSGHFPTLQSCPNTNCRYTTCCVNSMQNHIKNCKILADQLPTHPLPFTLYCVCSFSGNDGYIMAKHLAVCERKSAYPSVEAAKAATVTHSMLDVLGLVRRPEEPPAVQATGTPATTLLNSEKPIEEVMEIDSDDDKDKDDGTPQPISLEPVVEIDEGEDVVAKEETEEVNKEGASENNVASSEDEVIKDDDKSKEIDNESSKDGADTQNENSSQESEKPEDAADETEDVEKVEDAKSSEEDEEEEKEDAVIETEESENKVNEPETVDNAPSENSVGDSSRGAEDKTSDSEVVNEITNNDFSSLDVDDVEKRVQNLNDTVAEILENSINKEKQTPMDVDNNLDEILNANVQIDNLVNNTSTQNSVDMEL